MLLNTLYELSKIQYKYQQDAINLLKKNCPELNNRDECHVTYRELLELKGKYGTKQEELFDRLDSFNIEITFNQLKKIVYHISAKNFWKKYRNSLIYYIELDSKKVPKYFKYHYILRSLYLILKNHKDENIIKQLFDKLPKNFFEKNAKIENRINIGKMK